MCKVINDTNLYFRLSVIYSEINREIVETVKGVHSKNIIIIVTKQIYMMVSSLTIKITFLADNQCSFVVVPCPFCVVFCVYILNAERTIGDPSLSSLTCCLL